MAGDIIAPSPSQTASSLNLPSEIRTPWSIISPTMHGRLCTSVSPTYLSGIGLVRIVSCTSFDMFRMLAAIVLMTCASRPHVPRPPARCLWDIGNYIVSRNYGEYPDDRYCDCKLFCGHCHLPAPSSPFVPTCPTARSLCVSRSRRRCARSFATLT